LNGCIIAEFSKLKALQGSAFSEFRKIFKSQLIRSFIIPAYTFDNVTGNFPIGFKIWKIDNHTPFNSIISDVFDEKGNQIGTKSFTVIEKNELINKWISGFKGTSNYIGFLAGTNGNDMQQNRIVYILNKKEQMANPRGIWINEKNLISAAIYYSVRKCIRHTWLNDRDQFLYPNNGWKTDIEFQNDCLAYTLFTNNIQSKYGTNHWIPFTEYMVGARDKFDSSFMSDFIRGEKEFDLRVEEPPLLFYHSDDLDGGGSADYKKPTKREFSDTAKEVLRAGLHLWKYYHKQPNVNVNASLYDIREYFQGRNEKGTMNNTSTDEKYNELMNNLRSSLKMLAEKIEPKVYQYEFLKR